MPDRKRQSKTIADDGVNKRSRIMNLSKRWDSGFYEPDSSPACVYYEKNRNSTFSSRYLSILKTNRKYLEQTIQHDESHQLIQMLSKKVLKNQEDCIIMRQDLDSDKTRELLFLAKSFDEIQFNIFVECLRKTGQRHVVQLFEEGGVAVKVVVRNENTSGQMLKLKEEEKELVEKLRELQDATIPRSTELERLLNTMANDQMKILHAVHKSRIVLWIWCQTQSALEKLRLMSESSELHDLLSKLFRHLIPNGIVVPKTVIVHKEQSKKVVVNLRSEMKLAQTIDLRVERKCVKAVAKLHNNIYVLCQNMINSFAPNSVYIFESGNQFRLLQQIGLRDVVHPWDIAASPVGNCLYITDCATNSVWKVRPKAKFRVTKWKNNVTSPWTLSVQSNGYVLIARSQPHPILEIYRVDSTLDSVTTLPIGIQNPQHAVQTSEGNFVVLHWKKQEKSPMWMSSISEVSVGGRVLRCASHGEAIQQLDNPSHIFIDSADRVLVADSGKNRVIMVDSELNWSRVLLEEEQDKMRWPVRLFYDEKNRQLGVAGEAFGLNIYTNELTPNSITQ